MKIAVLGTGVVGRTIGRKLINLGHEVMMGSRSSYNEKAAEWIALAGKLSSQGTFADAARFGEVIFNCTQGKITIDALKLAGEENLSGKILIDLSNPLNVKQGEIPTLTVCNTDSLGEQIQQTFPDVKVVKTLNTVNCEVMVNPQSVNQGDHDIFVCGNDAGAKKTVTELLISFGWKELHIHDLGNISSARAVEMILPLWIRMMVKLGTAKFQFKIVK